jgi:hypothetical protein
MSDTISPDRDMNESDWIQLWLLNQLVLGDCHLLELLSGRVESPNGGYWTFPARAAMRADTETRVEALRTSVKQGLIAICPESWVNDPRFPSCTPCLAGECDFSDTRFVERARALLTARGHEKWEADFQPDWARFWSVDNEDYDENTHEVTLSVTYASNEMLDELRDRFPAYWNLDRSVGLQELECHTLFQYQATTWKVLLYAKVITWKARSALARSNELWRAAHTSASHTNDDEAKQEAMKQLQRYQQAESEARCRAERLLTRLSKRWDCRPASPSHHRDAEPELRLD